MAKKQKIKAVPLICDICGKGVDLRRGYGISLTDGILCHRKHGKKTT